MVPTPREALEDGERSEDISILARELSSIARVHDTISCILLELTQPNLTSYTGHVAAHLADDTTCCCVL